MPRRNRRGRETKARGIYSVTVHYVDEDGREVASDYRGVAVSGEKVEVVSPQIEGLTPRVAVLRMRAKTSAIEQTVVYRKDK